MRIIHAGIGFVFIICLLSSCAVIEHRIFSSTQINTPSLQHKNDHNFSLSASVPAGVDFQSSYALTNRLAILGGLFSYKNKDEEKRYSIFSSDRDSSLLLYKHKGFHLGTGGYFPLIKDRSPLFISVFGTYTNGDFKMIETLYDNSVPGGSKINYYNSDIKRLALQSSLHFYSKHIHQAFTTRYNYVVYANVNTDYTVSEQISYNLPPSGHSRYSSFVDFGFETRIFFDEKQKTGIQLFGSATARLNDKDFNFYYYPLRIGIGFIANSPFSRKK